MPGPPSVECTCEGLLGGGPSILKVRSITVSGRPVFGETKVGG